MHQATTVQRESQVHQVVLDIMELKAMQVAQDSMEDQVQKEKQVHQEAQDTVEPKESQVQLDQQDLQDLMEHQEKA